MMKELKTPLAIVQIVVLIAMGWLGGWHFSAEHTQLMMLQNAQIISMDTLGKSVMPPVASDSFLHATKRGK